MAIIIPHRFLDRVLPKNEVSFINTIIIGTFNPGLPDLDKLTLEERDEFDRISTSKKFQRFNLAKNFYDRPQNRFWKIMDFISNPDFYFDKKLRTKNLDGLKHYSRMDRETVFQNQTSFCYNQGIFITDIVRQIEPNNFDNIYDNFPDKAIEGAKCTWNTEGILNVIEKFEPSKILINFSTSKSIPKISREIIKIKEAYNNKTFFALSTSGAATNSYEILFEYWGLIMQ